MTNMASRRQENTKEQNAADVSNVDCLLHPELLSREFIQLVLHERKIAVGDHEDSDQLTDLYLRHVIPLPQRDLPNTRWAKRVQRCRERPSSSSANSSSTDSGRKRPLIVFDGSSTKTVSVKLKKPVTSASPVAHDRLKPPVSSVSLSNPIRKLSGSSTNSTSSNFHNRSPVSPPGSDHKSPSATCNNSNTANSSVHQNNALKRMAPSDTATSSWIDSWVLQSTSNPSSDDSSALPSLTLTYQDLILGDVSASRLHVE